MVQTIMHGKHHSAKPCMRGRRVLLALALWPLAACGTGMGPFAALDLPRTEAPEGAEWPRLADIPEMTGPGAEPAPDPETGREIAESLTREAAVQAALAEGLAGPVIPPAERAALEAARARARGR